MFRYKISIAGCSDAAKGGCFGFMGQFSVYHERVYVSGDARVPRRVPQREVLLRGSVDHL